jgi:hypothetical protein
MIRFFEEAPIESKISKPHFQLWECLRQIFGYDFIGNDINQGTFINHREDGFYDTSIQAYLPTLSKWILRHCRLRGIQLSQEQEDYIKGISMQEPVPEEWNTTKEVRLALIETYNFIQPNASKQVEDMTLFFEDMVVIWNADGLELMKNDPLLGSINHAEITEAEVNGYNRELLLAFSQAKNMGVRRKAMQIIASHEKLW